MPRTKPPRNNALTAAKKAAPPKAEAAKKAAEVLAAAEKTLNEKKKAAEKPKADNEAAKKALAEAEKLVQSTTEKAKQAKEALDKDANNDGLKKAKADADKALADAQKAFKDAENKLKATDKPLADAMKAVTDAQTAFNNAEKTSEQAAVDSKKAQDAIPAAEADLKTAQDEQKRLEGELEVAKKASTASEKPWRGVAFSPDNLQLALVGDDQLVHTYNGETGAAYDVFVGQGASTSNVAFASPTALVSVGDDKNAIVWDTAPTWSLERTIGKSTPLADRVIALDFSPNGKLLAVGGGEPSRSGELKIFNVSDGSLVLDLPDAHSDTVFGVAFSPDGKLIAGASADKFVKVFQVADGKQTRSFEGHTHHVMGVAWQFDGKLLASCGADNVIKVWDYETGEQKRTDHRLQQAVHLHRVCRQHQHGGGQQRQWPGLHSPQRQRRQRAKL